MNYAHGDTDMSEKTSIYMAGSIADSDDNGEQWRTDLQTSLLYRQCNVEFLNPLEEHHPEDDPLREEIVPDDLSLLKEADGILLKYEHGKGCWGTPSEQGYALAHNELVEDGVLGEEHRLPVAIWWERENQFFANEVSPWLDHERTAIGMYEDTSVALSYLLDEIGHEPMPFNTHEDEKVNLGMEDTTVLTDVLQYLGERGLSSMTSIHCITDAVEGSDRQIDQTLTFLGSVDVVGNVGVDEGVYKLTNSIHTREVLEEFTDVDLQSDLTPTEYGNQSVVTDS